MCFSIFIFFDDDHQLYCQSYIYIIIFIKLFSFSSSNHTGEFEQFVQRYRCLAPSSAGSVDELMKGLVSLGITNDIDCVKGKSKVFLRNKMAQDLESKREDALSVVASTIQRAARGFVARVQFKKYKEILLKLAKATEAKNVEDLEHYLRQS